ncbi:Neurochondrin-domain-containing protein [Apodospora peruviana]|uniref:Neurochondrin-domain-containing protein n=1 Tax=Apodospora peruviana TaxID=516989 RepID=A0AAE0M937_9PEZI|nr:Neurochondrin-domain-containing protein [Apodospora peruviana]
MFKLLNEKATMDEEAQAASATSTAQALNETAISNIKALLSAKDDTSRFVGLALLKSTLDNSEELRNDEAAITALWESISPKFLDGMIRTGLGQQGQGQGQDNHNMLEIAVSVINAFAALLPEDATKDKRILGRIPQLVAALTARLDQDVTKLTIDTLWQLVSFPEGAHVFNQQVDDLTPLTNIAPSQPHALEVLYSGWKFAVPNNQALKSKINKTIGALVSIFEGTDAVTLMDMLARSLPGLHDELFTENPEWLPALRLLIQNLVRSRPTSNGRAAWTKLVALLLEKYPQQAPQLLFQDDARIKGKAKDDGSTHVPFSYVMVSLLLVDIRASLPTLLEKLNSPEYDDISSRLAAAYDILSSFISYLLSGSDDDIFNLVMTPDLLLKLRKFIAETISLTLEYLRDRWDASVAGAMGLHPDSRVGPVHTSTNQQSHLALAWDSKNDKRSVGEDPLTAAAVMALALWLREDDGEVLRMEATGLMDMFVDLYRKYLAIPGQGLDIRWPILMALQGIIAEEDGIEAFLTHSGWEALSDDLVSVLNSGANSSSSNTTTSVAVAARRGVEIVRVLLPIVEAEPTGPREDWMDLVTKIAAVYVPDDEPLSTAAEQEFMVAALQLATSLLAGTHPGMQKRYIHSMGAISGLATRVRRGADKDDEGLIEAVDDVLDTLEGIRNTLCSR